MAAKKKRTAKKTTKPRRTVGKRVSAPKVARRAPTPSHSPKGGMSVDTWVADLEADHAGIVAALRNIIRAEVPRAIESIKWGQPVFEVNGPFAYIRASARHVTLGFWRGVELADPSGILEGEGTRMKHVKVPLDGELPHDPIAGFIREAVALNERLGSPASQRG